MGSLLAQPRQARSGALLQECIQAVLLLNTREHSLRLAIFSTGNGCARRAGGGIGASLGKSRPSGDGADRLPESSDGLRASGVAAAIAALGVSRNARRGPRSSHLAASISQPQSLRAYAELQFL